MKYLLLILIVTGSFVTRAQVTANKCIIEPVNGKTVKEDLVFEDSTIKVTIYSMYMSFWSYIIENKTDSDLKVNWNDSYFIVNGESSKAIKGDTRVLDVNAETPSQVLPAKSKITVELLPYEYFKYKSALNNKKSVKNNFDRTGKPLNVKLVILTQNGSEQKKHLSELNISPEKK